VLTEVDNIPTAISLLEQTLRYGCRNAKSWESDMIACFFLSIDKAESYIEIIKTSCFLIVLWINIFFILVYSECSKDTDFVKQDVQVVQVSANDVYLIFLWTVFSLNETSL